VYLCMKIKSETCWNYSKNGGGDKKNDGQSEFNLDICKQFLKCHNVPSVQWSNKK
jgi:hypothetical protein